MAGFDGCSTGTTDVRSWLARVDPNPNRSEATMELPRISSREEWLEARKKLLVKEKELTRARDALNVERRNLPMVEIEKDYVFDGPEGRPACSIYSKGASSSSSVTSCSTRAGKTVARVAPRVPRKSPMGCWIICISATPRLPTSPGRRWRSWSDTSRRRGGPFPGTRPTAATSTTTSTSPSTSRSRPRSTTTRAKPSTIAQEPATTSRASSRSSSLEPASSYGMATGYSTPTRPSVGARR